MAFPDKKFRIADRLAQTRRGIQPALSQSVLAEKVRLAGLPDCKASRISRLEAGYADAEWAEVEALAAVLNVTAQWLAGTPQVSAPPAPQLPAAPPTPPAPSVSPVASASPTTPVFPVAPVPSVAPAAVAPPGTPKAPLAGAAVPERGAYSDLADLERSAHRSDYDYRQHLAAALGRARTKLHEAGLPAAEWRHWRAVEKRAVDELKKAH